jgi:hypothetical protein
VRLFSGSAITQHCIQISCDESRLAGRSQSKWAPVVEIPDRETRERFEVLVLDALDRHLVLLGHKMMTVFAGHILKSYDAETS